MTNNVIQFPRRKALPGEMYCEERHLTFPALHRTHQSITRAQAYASMGDPDAAGEFYDYVFEPEAIASNTSHCTFTHERATHIVLGDQKESILIRHHETEADTFAYLAGFTETRLGLYRNGEEPWAAQVDALGGVYIEDIDRFERCAIEGVFFTKHNILTRDWWPGPLLIYMTLVTSSEGWVTTWVRAVDHTGKPFTEELTC